MKNWNGAFSIGFYLASISVGAWKNKRLKYGHQVMLTEALHLLKLECCSNDKSDGNRLTS
jgi:hypothetical protein